jgi:rhodanese-related sulfurtransferase
MKTSWWPKLGAVILLVAAGALILMGKPTYFAPVNSVEEWNEFIASGEDRVDPMTLAEWLVEERPGLHVIDIRPEMEFTRYAIKGSENIPFRELLTRDGLDLLDKHGVHVLVSEDGLHAGQAWVILRGMGYEAYVLEGGAQAWVEQILEGKSAESHPDLALKVHALREHFLGSGAAIGSAPPPAPPLSAPAPSTPKRGKKKAGGC